MTTAVAKANYEISLAGPVGSLEWACRHAAHSVIAEMQKVSADVIEALRDDKPIPDQNLEALRKFTTQVIEKRGWVDDADTRDFYAAGFSQQQVLEVVLGVAFKTISNYTNHITETPLDDAFAAREWHTPSRNVA